MFRLIKMDVPEGEENTVAAVGKGITLGRGLFCVPPDHFQISKQHCHLSLDPSAPCVWLTVLPKVRNAVFVGDVALPGGSRVRLGHGDEFCLVKNCHRFKVELAALPPSSRDDDDDVVEILDPEAGGYVPLEPEKKRVKAERRQVIIDVDALPPPPATEVVDLTDDVANLDMGRFTLQVRSAIAQLQPRFVATTPASRRPGMPFPDDLEPVVAEVLLEQGVDSLYSHQVQARASIRSGRDILVSTPTASGKSNCVLVPLLESIVRDPCATALFLFPLKALAQDQESKIRRWVQGIYQRTGQTINVQVFMGDMDPVAVFGRDRVNILLATPDKIHARLLKLGRLDGWHGFLRNLNYVVLDEAHVYRSAFGVNVANLMTRLRYAIVCAGGSEQLRYMVLTATIGNPLDLYTTLTRRKSEQVEFISESGAPQAARTLIVARAASNQAMSAIPQWCSALAGLRTLVFAESIFKVQELARSIDGAKAYYSSMKPGDKAALLKRFSNGSLSILCTTSALEAGIDFRSCDCVMLMGFPGANEFHQRAGRAGRNDPGLVIFFPTESPLDHYFETFPEKLHNLTPQRIFFPTLPELNAKHIACALYESPQNRILTQFFDAEGIEVAVRDRMVQLIEGGSACVAHHSFSLNFGVQK